MNTYKIAVSRYQLKAKLPPGDPAWSKFNASFENKTTTLDDLIDDVYTGKAITSHHKNNWRTSDNYICGQHIGLDFDNEDDRSTIKFLKSDKFIAKHGSFIHTTISHKPESPRSRVIFLLDNPIMQAANYTMAVTAILWLFGTADRQCKDAVRFFYGAPGCDVEILANRLPLDIVKKIISSYQTSGTAERKRSITKEYRVPATQQEVADALKLIPPWSVEYDEWVGILMGIHSEFGDAGYSLAETWADGKKGEVDQKWKSFKPGGQVTIATVFGIAKKFGWKKSIKSENIVV